MSFMLTPQRFEKILWTMLALGVILAAALSWQGFFDEAAKSLAGILGAGVGDKTLTSSLVLALLVTGFAVILLSWAMNGSNNNGNNNQSGHGDEFVSHDYLPFFKLF